MVWYVIAVLCLLLFMLLWMKLLEKTIFFSPQVLPSLSLGLAAGPKTSEKVFHRRNAIIVGFASLFFRLGKVGATSS